MRLALAAALTLMLAACGGDDTPTGGVSRDEARQLDEAAAKTDINAVFADENTSEAAE